MEEDKGIKVSFTKYSGEYLAIVTGISHYGQM
jgi:hypothetical protein